MALPCPVAAVGKPQYGRRIAQMTLHFVYCCIQVCLLVSWLVDLGMLQAWLFRSEAPGPQL